MNKIILIFTILVLTAPFGLLAQEEPEDFNREKPQALEQEKPQEFVEEDFNQDQGEALEDILSSQDVGIKPLLEINRLEGSQLRYSMELRDIELVDFFRVIAHDYGLNIVLDRDVQGRVRASFTNITMEDALEKVSSLYNLKLEKQGEVLFIKPNIITKVFRLRNITVQDLLRQHIEIRNLLEEAGLKDMQRESLSVSETGGSEVLRGDAQSASGKEAGNQGEAAGNQDQGRRAPEPVTRTVSQDISVGRASTIYDLLSNKGKIFVSSQANILMVKDYPANVHTIEEFLQIVDQKIAYKVFNLKYISVKDLFPELLIQERTERQDSRDERRAEREEIKELRKRATE